MSESISPPVAVEPRQSLRFSPGRLLLVAAAVAGLALAGRHLGAYIPAFAAWVGEMGIWGPVVFVVGYALAAVVFVPGSLLTLAAGAIFGLGTGVLVVFVGATLGASAAFLVSRHLARSRIENRLKSDPRFTAIDGAIGSEGRKIVFLLRLSPLFPFNLLNYGLGLTKVRFRDYLVASIGMLPGTLLYVYYGKIAGDLAALAGASANRGAAHYVVLGLGLLATVVATTLVTRTARRALEHATGGGSEQSAQA